MMRTFRKQNHQDFRNRIKRVDPVFYRWGERGAIADATPHRPFGSLLMGFGWAYLVISVSNNRAVLESSLRQGSLPEQYHDMIFMGLAALLAMSLVMLAIHLFRFFAGRKGGKRRNSGALLTGVMGALMLIYTPASVWQTGFGMMDGNSRSFVMAASATMSEVIPGVDLNSAVFVSSIGK